MKADTGQVIPDDSCHVSVCDLSSAPEQTIPEQHISDLQSFYVITLTVECKHKQTDIPQNIILGNLRPIQEEDTKVFEEAAENTSTLLAETWMQTSSQTCHLQPLYSLVPHQFHSTNMENLTTKERTSSSRT